jgi:hypothetical protein
MAVIRPHQTVEVFYKGRYRYGKFVSYFDDEDCFVEIRMPGDEKPEIVRVEITSVKIEYAELIFNRIKTFFQWAFSLRLQSQWKKQSQEL